jgi:predicted XRE-type DNA-binding protein
LGWVRDPPGNKRIGSAAIGIRERVKAWAVPQEEAAKRLGLTRPRLNDLLRGKIDKFSLDALVNIATAAGYALHITLDAA